MSYRYQAVCATHGRGHLIHEAVESFIRQTNSDDLGMFILNDCPEQPLSCDHPRVRIVNLPEPIPNFAAKMNATIELADGEYLMWWDDDDISLPWRYEWTRAVMDANRLDYFRVGWAWIFNNGVMEGTAGNVFFGSSCFRRQFYLDVGGADEDEPGDVSADVRMQSPAGRHLIVTDKRAAAGRPFFVYKWGRSDLHHDSCVSGTNAERFAAFRGSTINHRCFINGPVHIAPRWDHEYARIAEGMEV